MAVPRPFRRPGMKQRFVSALVFVLACATAPVPSAQQKVPVTPAKKNPYLKLAEPWPEPAVLLTRRTEAEKRPLFETVDPLAFTLTADFKTINKDRRPESTARYPGILSVTDEKGLEQAIKVKL